MAARYVRGINLFVDMQDEDVASLTHYRYTSVPLSWRDLEPTLTKRWQWSPTPCGAASSGV